MKSKTRLPLSPLSTTDKIGTAEPNGLINPAFLAADRTPPDYREHITPQTASPTRNGHPITNHWSKSTTNGPFDSQTSSWVYNFNSHSPSVTDSPMDTTLPLRSRFAEFGSPIAEHMSYQMDLSEEHAKSRKWYAPDVCRSRCLRVFAYTVIAVCVLGIVSSVAFIVYIEKFADRCDSKTSANATNNSPDLRSKTGVMPAGDDSDRVSNSTYFYHTVGTTDNTTDRSNVTSLATSTAATVDFESVNVTVNASSEWFNSTSLANTTTVSTVVSPTPVNNNNNSIEVDLSDEPNASIPDAIDGNRSQSALNWSAEVTDSSANFTSLPTESTVTAPISLLRSNESLNNTEDNSVNSEPTNVTAAEILPTPMAESSSASANVSSSAVFISDDEPEANQTVVTTHSVATTVATISTSAASSTTEATTAANQTDVE